MSAGFHLKNTHLKSYTFSLFKIFSIHCYVKTERLQKNNNIVTISKTLIQTDTKYRACNIMYNHCLLYIAIKNFQSYINIDIIIIIYTAHRNHTHKTYSGHTHMHTQHIYTNNTHTYIFPRDQLQSSHRERERMITVN